MNSHMLTPEDLLAMLSFIHEQRAQAGLPDRPFDVAHAGLSSGTDHELDCALALAYSVVGVTWWLEHLVPER
jgi:hypothetical protein